MAFLRKQGAAAQSRPADLRMSKQTGAGGGVGGQLDGERCGSQQSSTRRKSPRRAFNKKTRISLSLKGFNARCSCQTGSKHRQIKACVCVFGCECMRVCVLQPSMATKLNE